jgi:hypothetical protein
MYRIRVLRKWLNHEISSEVFWIAMRSRDALLRRAGRHRMATRDDYQR